MEGSVSPPHDERIRTIFMPLVTDLLRGPAAEDKDYRPVRGEWLEGDLYRVVSVQPDDERWEYPSGATVFAVRLHSADDVRVIVAPFSEPEVALGKGPADRPDAHRRAASRRSRGAKLRRTQKRARLRLARQWRSLQGGKIAQMLLMVSVIAATAYGWLGRAISLHFDPQPADPIRASVVASAVVLICGLWRARDRHQLRALRIPSVLVGAAFVLSLLIGRYHT